MVDKTLLDMLQDTNIISPIIYPHDNDSFINIHCGVWAFGENIKSKFTKEEIIQAMNIIERE